MKAYSASTTPKALKDEQATPRIVFNRIETVLNIRFIHDVCATKKNTKCTSYWNKRDNALKRNWLEEIGEPHNTAYDIPAFWMNPPYSMLPEFTAKAMLEARKGCIVVGLIPHISSSRWYQQYVHNVASAVFLPDGRINFELQGVVRPGNALPSCFPVWTPWRCSTSYQFFKRKTDATKT